jgi:hypothetical protein
MNKPRHDLPLGHIDFCQVCGSKDLELILDLGHQAPCDSLLTAKDLNEMERTYPLHFVFCPECGLAQIDYVVDPKLLFYSEYPYRSGITGTLVNYLQSIAVNVLGSYEIDRKRLVVDIGSNDGTLLSGFRKFGIDVLGVEPTNIAEIANRNGVRTIKAFFTEDLSAHIVEKYGKASVVTATNMFAHVCNLGELIRGVSDLLTDDGIFLTESHYLLDLLKTLQYDSIYHEHLKYYSLKPLIQLFEYYDFQVVDAERIPNYGGSIRVMARKGKVWKRSDRLEKLLVEEAEFGLYRPNAFHNFKDKVEASKNNLRKLLVELRSGGSRIPGVGCPGRSSTLINYCSIDIELMPYIAEQSNSLKIGLHLPGAHIPIVDEDRLFHENPPYCLMLSWHYAEPIIASLRRKGLKSRVIVPLPEVRIFESS